MLRFILQIKRKYKSKNKKETADKTEQETIKNDNQKNSARLTKRLKKVQIITPTKTKTVMCHSKKQLTLQKKKKIGLNTSREVPKKQKNT